MNSRTSAPSCLPSVESGVCASALDAPTTARKTATFFMPRSLAIAGWLGSDGGRQRESRIVIHVADLEIVAVGRRGVVALVRRDVNFVPRRSIGAGAQAAFLQLRLHGIGVPRRD